MKFLLKISASLILRPLELSDVENIARHANNKKIWINLTDIFPHPYSIEDAYIFIDLQTKIFPPRVFGIIFNDEAIGTIGLNVAEENGVDTADIGYWISEYFWNKGIMTQVIERTVKFGFDFYKDLVSIQASVFAYNPASCRVLEKVGFQLDRTKVKSILKAGREERLLVYSIHRK